MAPLTSMLHSHPCSTHIPTAPLTSLLLHSHPYTTHNTVGASVASSVPASVTASVASSVPASVPASVASSSAAVSDSSDIGQIDYQLCEIKL